MDRIFKTKVVEPATVADLETGHSYYNPSVLE